jgi:hypothetical protein
MQLPILSIDIINIYRRIIGGHKLITHTVHEFYEVIYLT